MKSHCMTIQMKAIEQYFHVVLFIMLYKVVLTFKSVDETLKCDHSNVGANILLFVFLNFTFIAASIFLLNYSTVEPKHAETAGTMMAFMLIIGLGMGAGFSFVITMFL